MSHTRALESAPPEASRPPVLANDRHVTAPRWPVSVSTHAGRVWQQASKQATPHPRLHEQSHQHNHHHHHHHHHHHRSGTHRHEMEGSSPRTCGLLASEKNGRCSYRSHSHCASFVTGRMSGWFHALWKAMSGCSANLWLFCLMIWFMCSTASSKRRIRRSCSTCARYSQRRCQTRPLSHHIDVAPCQQNEQYYHTSSSRDGSALVFSKHQTTKA
jgi:hypothetical protein